MKATTSVPQDERNSSFTILAICGEVESGLRTCSCFSMADDTRNYYMEREWRTVVPVEFAPPDIERILIPRRFAPNLRHDLPDYFGQLTFTD